MTPTGSRRWISIFAEATRRPCVRSAVAPVSLQGGPTMARYRGTLVSTRSAEDTFDYMADFANAAEWDPGTVSARAARHRCRRARQPVPPRGPDRPADGLARLPDRGVRPTPSGGAAGRVGDRPFRGLRHRGTGRRRGLGGQPTTPTSRSRVRSPAADPFSARCSTGSASRASTDCGESSADRRPSRSGPGRSGLGPAAVDELLEATVVGSFSSIGPAVRSRTAGWGPPPRMDGRRVLVTGATSGLGLAAATALARLGAEVVLTARGHDRAERAVAAGARVPPPAPRCPTCWPTWGSSTRSGRWPTIPVHPRPARRAGPQRRRAHRAVP